MNLVIINTFKIRYVTVTGRTRRETCGSIGKALFTDMIIHSRGRASANRYVYDKTKSISKAGVDHRSAYKT